MKLIFDTNGNDKQKEVCRHWLNPIVTDIVYGGSKGSGKSFLGCNLIFGDAFLMPETHFFIARKKLNDIRKFTIPSIYEVFDYWGLNDKYYRFNGQDNYFTLYNGSKVFLLEAKYLPSDPQYYRFGSMQMTGGWIEEAGEFESDAKQNLQASIGRWKNDKYNYTGKLLQTCNPSKNYLYKDYYLKNKKGELEYWKRFVQALPTDNKMLDKNYIENLNRTLSINAKERLLKGNWEYDDDPSALCDYDSIIGIFTNIQAESGQKYITCDVARQGSDKAVIMVWLEDTIIEIVEFDVSKTTLIQGTINALRRKHNIPAKRTLADEDGVGGGVVDNCSILGFTNNARAFNDENYANLQTQCGYYLADAINKHEISVGCDVSEKQKEQIIEELEQLKSFEEDKDSKLKILPKQQIKDNIGRSPDYRDCMLMKMYWRAKNKTLPKKYFAA
jgi:phage terminase large subunit